MKEALLITAIVLIMIIGYFIMKRLDVFLDKNKKTTDKKGEKEEETQVFFLSDSQNDQKNEEKGEKEKTE